MRVTNARALPGVKIAQGMTGQFYASCNNTHWDDGGLNTAAITGAGFNCHRGGVNKNTNPSGVPAANANAELVRYVAAGLKLIYPIAGVAGTDKVLYSADVAGWNAYWAVAIPYAIATYGAANLPFIEWRNEPPGTSGFVAATAAAIGAEMTPVAAIVASYLPNALFGGPAILGFGGTAGRGTGTGSLAQYISNGGLGAASSNVMFNYHHYGGNPLSLTPEVTYGNEGLWLSLTALQARSDLPIGLSEFGYQTSTPGNYYVPEADQGKWVARMYLIYRAHWNCRFCDYYEIRDGTGTYGLLNNDTSQKASYQTAKDGITRVLTWVNAASYSRGIFPIQAARSGLQYTQLHNCPWFVRGTLANGDEELAVWHASLLTWPDQVVVYNSTGVAQTLSIKTLGGSTATQSVPAGTSTVSVTLTDTPKVLFGTGLRWPEFQH